ncbi:MAG: protein translocase subunit SecD [Gemmatimonas sp.]|nr:protein translocase subunit SecD [Gemmatimonas sp.]
MNSLKARLLVIAAMVVASAWALFPRTVEDRFQRDGVMVDTTYTRIPLKYGLDLRGGMHLALEIDQSQQQVSDVNDALERALRVVRSRIDEFGVAEPIVQRVGDRRIEVELPGIDDRERAIAVVQRSAFLRFQITDRTQALERVAPRLDQIAKARGLEVATTTATGDTARSSGLGGIFQTPTDSAAGDSAATPTDGPFRRLIAPGSLPGQYYVANSDVRTLERLLADSAIRNALPPGKVVRWGADSVSISTQWYRPLYVLDNRDIITGEYLVDAKPEQDPMEGAKVTFQLNNEGGRRFRNETGRNIGNNMAIVLDDKVMSAPVIQGAIGTRGQITMGGRDIQPAQDLALVLRAGALPVPLTVVETRTIGASLGADAIQAGIYSGVAAVLIVIVIMVGYYRFSGFLAVIGLFFYTLITLAILATFDATLTLPGIAGFVLSIGMAVDANFLVFERIREELDAGKSIRLAIDEGFDHAWSAIVDTHVTTALTAVILYQFGDGPVRGFAVTLLAGIIASLASAIFFVRTLYYVWLSQKKQAPTTLSI